MSILFITKKTCLAISFSIEIVEKVLFSLITCGGHLPLASHETEMVNHKTPATWLTNRQ